jgi:hypothetical protein
VVKSLSGQSWKDREWPKPRHTRFVWVSQPGLQVAPVQGLVLDWRRHSYRWSALVVTVREVTGTPPVVMQEWTLWSVCGPFRQTRTARLLLSLR